MLSALASRTAMAAAVLLISGLLAATLVRLAPGFGTDERLLDIRLRQDSIDAIRRENASSSSPIRYYGEYLRKLSHGDLGTSLSLNRPVRELLAERLPVTVRSGFSGLLLAWIAAAALVSALELSRHSSAESLATMLSGSLLCVPAAVIALASVYIGAAPHVAIAAVLFPRLFRYLRNLARQACGASHVLTAHALGMAPIRILVRHVVAPVLPELAALAGVSVSMAVGAAIPVEALCDLPGVGQLVWQSALARDLPVLVNVTLLITAVTLVANLAADTARSAREALA
jgi:peptide/nickel transport system permease protein